MKLEIETVYQKTAKGCYYFRYQINNVADWVEKIVCWEYAYFTQIETKAARDLQKQIFLKEG